MRCGSSRVLLADDHADVARHRQSILEVKFDVVGTVADGSALMTAAAALEPDVIVTDLAMPVVDGIQATAEIVRRVPDARIVLITSHVEAEVQRRGLAAGALGYVGKFRADVDLVPAVRAALRGEHFVGEKR